MTKYYVMKTLRIMSKTIFTEDELLEILEPIGSIRMFITYYSLDLENHFLSLTNYKDWIKDELKSQTTIFYMENKIIKFKVINFDLDEIWILGACIIKNDQVREVINNIKRIYQEMKHKHIEFL